MPVLILDFAGKRERAVLNGGATIGRTPNNDVVIDHSAVSRTHAIIESSDGAYFISDNRSKNGTIVGKHTLRDKRRLHDGERIEIGPAVLTFHLSDDVDIDDDAPTVSAVENAGMLMNCECGAKLWIPTELIGGRGQCQKCGRTLALEAPAPPSVPVADSVVSLITALAEPPSAPQDAVKQDDVAHPHVARVCSICQWKIEASDTAHTCPACGLVVHQECWDENRGCSAYGCSQVGILDTPVVAPVDEAIDDRPEEIGHPPVVEAQPHGFPWEFALLASSVIGSIVGLLLFGSIPMIVMLLAFGYLLKTRVPTKKPVLIGTMMVSLIGVVAGLFVSCFWWLNMRVKW